MLGIVSLAILVIGVVVSVDGYAHHDHESQHVLKIPDHAILVRNGIFDLEVIQGRLANCEVVKELNDILKAREHGTSSIAHRMFQVLFPFGPGLNALLAMLYISGPPTVVLMLVPPNINPTALTALVSFSVGCLLGDIFLHLLPQIFIGESYGNDVRLVLVDQHRNTLLGAAIFCGFLAFIILDKTMRIVSGSFHEHDHGHSHSHSHKDSDSPVLDIAKSSAVEASAEKIKQRAKSKSTQQNGQNIDTAKADVVNVQKTDTTVDVAETPGPSPSVKLSAYLNLIADFTHNITNGLALTASFYVSKSVGTTTFVAMVFHEIPHELGDFALLIQGGFSRSQARKAQLVTALGALIGTLLGIALNNISSGASGNKNTGISGLFGTTVQIGDLVLPFTAGAFLYITTIGVIPEILASGGLGRPQHIKQALTQLVACAVGFAIMFHISWDE